MEHGFDVDEIQLVVFELADESYGVEISRVQDINRMQEITEIPHAPESVVGVINLRGRVIPVVDLRTRFGMPGAEHTKSTRIVVVQMGEEPIGMIVDAVSQVLRIPTKVIEPPSPVLTSLDSRYLLGIAKLEDELVILLDLDYVLSKDEQEFISEAMAESV
ncbi:MAG: chemotaxis protein CheW [Bacillota bacterium]|nr:chemotaxis protein CheW [Bacillota bacterium]NLH88408.1 chemotaxis protein CheW [Bacillota bacterium]